MTLAVHTLTEKVQAARQASRRLAHQRSDAKDRAVRLLADALLANEAAILGANEQDVADAEAGGMSPAMIDRLVLNPARLTALAADGRAAR
ncbi:MAG: hypothetical protein NTZ05_14220 [Chloroflexi bacterium]|nr:hypothetical protein [Chloroflexota bacterium]